MRLLSVTVGGFRNVAETTIELGGITALVSPNNYGKSNLLDAITFATGFLNESPKARSSMMGYVGAIPLVPALARQDFCFRVTFEDPELGAYRYVRYGFTFSWLRNDGGGRGITSEMLEISARPGGRPTNYLRRDRSGYRRSYDTRSFRTIHLDDNQLAIDVLTAIEEIDINPVIKKIKEIGFSLCASIDASGRFSPMPLEMRSGSDNYKMAAFDDEDLPRALYGLKVSHRERFDNLLVALYTLFPEFVDISVNRYELQQEEHDALERQLYESAGVGDELDIPFRIRDELYRMTVRSTFLNQPVNVALMSAGTKRIVWLLANVVIAQAYDAQLIGIEELETSIHPKMLGELLELLDENSEKTSLLITSHSPFLIQYLKPSQIYLGKPGDDGVARFKRIRQDAIAKVRSYAHDNGLGFGECLFEMVSSDGDGTSMLARVLEA